MENTNWLKQTPDKPLFPDLLWSRPENKRQAGKLLIVGGNSHGFAAPITSYSHAVKAGIGSARVVLPDSLQKVVGTSFSEAEFGPSTPSGSLARRSLDMLLDGAKWADGVLLAGDFGRNSETAILLSSFMEKYDGQVTVAGDGLDYFLNANSPLMERSNTTAVINMGKIQKLGKNNRSNPPVKHSMGLHELSLLLSEWKAQIITKHADNFVISANGQISTTPVKKDINWQIELAAYASVWELQNPTKIFKALTSAVFEMQKQADSLR